MKQVDESCHLRYGPGKRSRVICLEWDALRLIERQRDRDTETQRERTRERTQERETKREKETRRKKKTERKRESERKRMIETDRHRHTHRHRHRHTHTNTHTSKRAHDRAHTSISRCPLELGEVKGHAFIFIFTFADYDCAYPQFSHHRHQHRRQ